MSTRTAVLLVLALGVSAGCGERVLSGPQPGHPFPELPLVRLADGEPADLSGYRGKALLVNFWATWCEPCRREMPALDALARSFDPARLTVLGVTVDNDLNLAREFVLKHRLTFENYADPGMAKTRALLAANVLPVTYLIGSDGKLLARFTGERDWAGDAMRRELDAAVR